MKKLERIKAKVMADKEIMARINRMNHYDAEMFAYDGFRYIKAIKENRIINSIGSVSSSGMSRTIKFLECHRLPSGQYTYYTFWAFFKALGYSEASKHSDYFRINGCGMDMIFHTNYTNIHRLHSLGFIDRKQCDMLAQRTPTTI